MDERRQRVLRFVDIQHQRGLEFGPLDRPLVSKIEGEIFYVDHLPTQALREKYRNTPGYNIDNIVDVDFVWGDTILSDLVGSAGPFDYVIASHVIEHVPDVVGWLNEICDVLNEGGIISFVIPDKRFIFDLYRPLTTLADLVGCHLEKRRRPSARQIFEAYSLHASGNCAELWASPLVPTSVSLVHDELFAFQTCKEVIETGKYLDVHCSVFTPQSFHQLIETLIRINLIRCSIQALYPTQPNESEFFVSLIRR